MLNHLTLIIRHSVQLAIMGGLRDSEHLFPVDCSTKSLFLALIAELRCAHLTGLPRAEALLSLTDERRAPERASERRASFRSTPERRASFQSTHRAARTDQRR